MEGNKWKCAMTMVGAIGIVAMAEGELHGSSMELRYLEASRKRLELSLFTYLHAAGTAFVGRDLRSILDRFIENIAHMHYTPEQAIHPISDYLELVCNGELEASRELADKQC